MDVTVIEGSPPARDPQPDLRAVVGAVTLDLWRRDALLRRIDGALAGVLAPLVVTSVNLDHLHQFGDRAAALPAGDHDGTVWTAVLDGRPVAAMARRRAGDPSFPVLPGSEILPEALAMAARLGARVALVGGSAATRTAWPEALARDFPGTVAAGTWPVDWAWLDQPGNGRRLADSVAEAGVDLLVVTLGKPRQETWLRDHGARSGARVALPFGSAADYIAGTSERPPAWASERGLEWLVRLAREPRRLWRRYLLEGPAALARLRTLRIDPSPDPR
jgi:exopolysaccharide biosynthesis WecB/TagA/CpsF family protein